MGNEDPAEGLNWNYASCEDCSCWEGVSGSLALATGVNEYQNAGSWLLNPQAHSFQFPT